MRPKEGLVEHKGGCYHLRIVTPLRDKRRGALVEHRFGPRESDVCQRLRKRSQAPSLLSASSLPTNVPRRLVPALSRASFRSARPSPQDLQPCIRASPAFSRFRCRCCPTVSLSWSLASLCSRSASHFACSRLPRTRSSSSTMDCARMRRWSASACSACVSISACGAVSIVLAV
jgi:hypothetical protein